MFTMFDLYEIFETIRKISIFVKIFENVDFSHNFRKISISTKTFE